MICALLAYLECNNQRTLPYQTNEVPLLQWIQYIFYKKNILVQRIYLLFQTELSQTLHQLSEEAKAMTEYIQLVKGSGDKINVCTLLYTLFIL